MGKWSADHRPKFSFTKSYIPFINNSSTTNYVNKGGQGKTFIPYAPNQEWVQFTHKNVQHGKNNVDNNKNGIAFESKKYAYSNNYKGKNPMTRTLWRRYQRSKKGVATSLEDKSVDLDDGRKMVESGRRPAKERMSLPLVEENPDEDDDWVQSLWIQNQTSMSYTLWFSFYQLNMIWCLKSMIQKMSSIIRTWKNTNPCVTL